MDALIPSMTEPTPAISGGVQPKALLSDIIRPMGPLDPSAVAPVRQDSPSMMPPTMMQPPQPRQSTGAASAMTPIGPGPSASESTPYQKNPMIDMAVNAASKLISGLGEQQSEKTNLASSSASGMPSEGMSYQTPFFRIIPSLGTGPTGDNANRNLF